MLRVNKHTQTVLQTERQSGMGMLPEPLHCKGEREQVRGDRQLV